jgi:hypothetical protein
MNSHHGRVSGDLVDRLSPSVVASRRDVTHIPVREVAGRAEREPPPATDLRRRFAETARVTITALGGSCRTVLMALRPSDHGRAKCFERELQQAGGVVGAVDRGFREVPTARVVGSVSRWQHLRGDFLDRTNPRITERHLRVAQAMREGTPLPPLELYKIRLPQPDTATGPASEYYVVDGHHRVAMARRLGQDYLDCHVVEYKVARGSNRGPEQRGQPV